jgi:putative ABC transport system permease protein
VNDLRVAIRHHRRQPGFALTVVLTLALTIGATAAMFSIVNTVLLKALPYNEADRLVWVTSVRTDNPDAPFTLPEFLDYRRQARTLSGLAAYANWSASLAGDGITERFQGARMSANGFDVLGVTPAAGRLLNDSDDRADAPKVVVLSYRLWQRQFGGRVEALGKSARINGEPFVIVGVLPQQFPLPLLNLDVITPLVPDRDPLRHLRGSVNFLRLVGRLAPGVDETHAQLELTTICQALRQQFPVEYARKESVKTVPLRDVIVGNARQSLLILFAAVMVVLAAALANLVSLALVRANGQRGELSMRLAIGASWLRLGRALAFDALLLVAIGSALGWMLAHQAIVAAVIAIPSSVPRIGEVRLDTNVASVIILLAIVATILLTIAPLAVASRLRASDPLRSPSRGATGDRWSQRVRNVMVIGEIAAALSLLLSTGVLVQDLIRLQDVQPGFQPDGVFQARVSIPATYRSPDDVTRFYEQLSEPIAATPGVQQVGMISVAPLSGLLATIPFTVEGQSPVDRDRPTANLRIITPGYFTTVGTRVVQGRRFAETDRSNAPAVAMVSAALADRFLSGDAVGRRILIDDNNDGPRSVEVVGVVENVRQAALDAPPAFDIYLPLRQLHRDGVALVRNNQFWMLRVGQSTLDPTTLRTIFVRRLRAVDPDAAVSDTGTMRQFVDASLGPRRFTLGLFGAFALTTVLLAVLGLYGLVSYAVSQRAGEIGLRLAIGATPRTVQQMMLRQAARLGIVGVLLGLGVTMTARALISQLAPSVNNVTIDPTIATATAIVLVAIVLLAAWLPARRASHIEPTVALRN